jgi:deazaflavin-dependent oxidoreductase (nitroreductase family)
MEVPMVTASPARAPRLIPLFTPLATRLLRMGRIMGPNTLLTVRGRKSGEMRTTPVAMVEVDGKRWIIGTFGDTNWVRNLRAAGEAEISTGSRHEKVRSVELSREEGARFFAEVVTPTMASGRLARAMLRMLGASEIVTDPRGAAEKRPVFELRPID